MEEESSMTGWEDPGKELTEIVNDLDIRTGLVGPDIALADETEAMTACVAHFKEQTRAGERLGQPPRCTTKTGPQALYPTEVDVRFPPGVWSDFPKGTLVGPTGYSQPSRLDRSLDDTRRKPLDREGSQKGVMGLQLWEMGLTLGESLRGSISLCSQPTEGGEQSREGRQSLSTFPLPTRRELVAPIVSREDAWTVDWLCAICNALNSLWGCSKSVTQEQGQEEGTSAVSETQARIVRGLAEEVTRLKEVREVTEAFDWGDFFRTRTIDYKGDEVKTALSFCWDNIRPALPKEIGVAALVDICELGCRHYVENFPSFLKPPSEWGPVRKARVMAKDADWFAVAQGLIEAGVFGVVPESEVFRVNSKLLLNGLFGVEKGEEDQGIPIYRLIMNLVPLNDLCQGLAGDIHTLPHCHPFPH